MLEEFEISCGEPFRTDSDYYYNDWAMWLPSTDRKINVPNLQSVTLSSVPFKWSSPLLSSNLRTLDLRSSSSVNVGGNANSNMTLDRLLLIITSNPLLENLTLNYPNSQQSVLPLETTRLNHLKVLNISGNYSMQPLIAALVTPSLEELTINTGRDAPDEAVGPLIARSGNPPITYLSLSYGGHFFGPYLSQAALDPHPWAFLANLDQLKTLKVGHAHLDIILEELAHVNHESNTWLVPHLEHLALKNSQGRSDCVSKVVELAKARNPPLPDANGVLPQYVTVTGVGANGNAGPNPMGFPIVLDEAEDATPPPAPPPPLNQPVRLKSLEMHHCTPIGEDRLKWLRSCIEHVDVLDPIQPRCVRAQSPWQYTGFE